MKKRDFLNRFVRITIVTIITISLLLVGLSSVEAKKFNMSYLYFGKTDTFIEQVNKTNDSVDTVSPSYFDLFFDGSLDEKVDPYFVEKMHEKNIKVVPFLSNHWDRAKGRAALINRELLVEQLVEAIFKYDLDGVNVDIENVTEIDRYYYTDLVKLLREQLPEDKEVSVAVAVNPYKWDKGWQASYDYEELAKYSDYLMLMTYDESYYGSAPGPVASMEYVEKSIQSALEEAPANKVVLGIPFYGRYWQLGKKGGRGIPIYQVEELVEKYNGKIYFDDKSMSPYAIFTIPYGKYSMVHGRYLSPGKYVVWYENDRSIKNKLKLVQKYNLLGTGSWSLNEAPEEIWSYYQSWLNGDHYFVDAENHWAEYDILSMFDKGWMVGTTSESFSPNNSLTRAQATVVLVRALGLNNKLKLIDDSIFKDVKKDYWAKDEIALAYQSGIVRGTGEARFSPNQTLTRAEMAAMLSRVLNNKEHFQIQESLINPFGDVSSSHWAFNDIISLNKQKIFMGFNDGMFHPSSDVTRAQMAALMNRISSYIEDK